MDNIFLNFVFTIRLQKWDKSPYQNFTFFKFTTLYKRTSTVVFMEGSLFQQKQKNELDFWWEENKIIQPQVLNLNFYCFCHLNTKISNKNSVCVLQDWLNLFHSNSKKGVYEKKKNSSLNTNSTFLLLYTCKHCENIKDYIKNVFLCHLSFLALTVLNKNL